MAIKQVVIPDIGPVTLFKRRGNRSLRLSITSTGEVRVSLPYWLPYTAGEQFAISRASWIRDNRGMQPLALQHGFAIGKAHRLRFLQHPTLQTVTTRVASNEIIISVPEGLSLDDLQLQQAATKAAIRALRKEAEVLLPQRLEALASKAGFRYSSVSIKQLKSRWGSCNTRREIVLNLFLMQLPWHLIDYVLVHELTHTKVMRHGPPFWTEMERHLPHAKQLRAQMASYQPKLSPIDRTVA